MSRTDELRAEAARNLEQGVNTGNWQMACEGLQKLIKIPTKLVIRGKLREYYCISHQILLGQKKVLTTAEEVFNVACCPEKHLVCTDCATEYVKRYFPVKKLAGHYDCPGCAMFNLPGSTLFLEEHKADWLRYLLGEVYEEEMKLPEVQELDLAVKCKSCGNKGTDIEEVSLCEHTLCMKCVLKIVEKDVDADSWKCKIDGCTFNIFHSLIYQATSGNNDLLSKVYKKLDLSGVHFIYCVNGTCKQRLEVNSEQGNTVTCPKCKNILCVRCGNLDHYGVSCVESSMGINEYKLIDLNPTDHTDDYNRALVGFMHSVNRSCSVKQIKLIVNPELKRRFLKKRQKLIKAGYAEESLVYHGSWHENYDSITRGGFKIGFIDTTLTKVNAHAYGYGIYTALSPDTPMGYAADSKWVLSCKALKGNVSGKQALSAEDLNSAKHHSYMPHGDWIIFFNVDQLLPKYLIEYE